MLIKLRKQLHAHAELSHCEQQTIQILIEFLKKYTTLEIHQEEGWFYAVHKEDAQLPTVAIRADMDAICDSQGKVYHGCGHDGHSAILAGIGYALEDKKLGKNIILVFQPAEEIGEGAKLVCDTLFNKEKIHTIYGFHNIPGFELGKILMRNGSFACASKGFTVAINGKQSHAAYPDQGANPAALLCNLVGRIPAIIKDITGGDENRLLMATVVNLVIGEKNFGISAGEGELSLTLRAYRKEDMAQLQKEIEAFCMNGCIVQKMTCHFRSQDEFPDTVNSIEVYNNVVECLEREKIAYEQLKEPMRWSEDFGWYLKEVPGLFLGIGAGHDSAPLHTDSYEFNDSIINQTIDNILKIVAS